MNGFRGAAPTTIVANHNRQRRGIAVVLVLGLLAMTLALAYASLRGQAAAQQLAENAGRGADARVASESGVYAALHEMSAANWEGIASSLKVPVTDHSWFEVSYLSGDARLTPGDPEYAELPFRVTILSRGWATDPADPEQRALHTTQAVVQLSRRTLPAEPAGWSLLEPLAVQQWSNQDVVVQFPARIGGRARLGGRLKLAADYPELQLPLEHYLGDLNARRLAGKADQRVFGDAVLLPFARQDNETLQLLQGALGLTTIDSAATDTSPVGDPGNVVSYRLFSGGKDYSPPILQDLYGASLQNLSLGPDPQTNPLGIFRSRSSLAIRNNVQIRGTIITEGTTPDIQIYGTNVRIEAIDLPPVEGTSQIWQLPAVIVRDDLRVHGGSETSLVGQAVVFDDFEVRSGAYATQFKLHGQLLTADLALRGRSEFDALTTLQWTLHLTSFETQPAVPYFPDWLEQQAGLPATPRITLERGAAASKYHWPIWSQPVYQPDPADAGLRWNLVGWAEK